MTKLIFRYSSNISLQRVTSLLTRLQKPTRSFGCQLAVCVTSAWRLPFPLAKKTLYCELNCIDISEKKNRTATHISIKQTNKNEQNKSSATLNKVGSFAPLFFFGGGMGTPRKFVLKKKKSYVQYKGHFFREKNKQKTLSIQITSSGFFGVENVQ